MINPVAENTVHDCDFAPKSQSKAKEFRKKLLEGPMVADGAMGTVLYSKGIFINRCFDELNLSSPDLVKEVHQEYVKAGAEIIETNTLELRAPA